MNGLHKLFMVMFISLVLFSSLVVFSTSGYAESTPPQTTGHYVMAAGEVYELHCGGGPEQLRPAVNLYQWKDGSWRVFVGCPQELGGDYARQFTAP